MDTRRLTLTTAFTLVAAYLGLFVGLIDANAVNLALPAGWVKRGPRGRAVLVTTDGRTALTDTFGIEWAS
jgi:hypothetical protein